MIALAFAPLGDVEKSQFFRPTTKGLMAFSARLLSTGMFPFSKNRFFIHAVLYSLGQLGAACKMDLAETCTRLTAIRPSHCKNADYERPPLSRVAIHRFFAVNMNIYLLNLSAFLLLRLTTSCICAILYQIP